MAPAPDPQQRLNQGTGRAFQKNDAFTTAYRAATGRESRCEAVQSCTQRVKRSMSM